MPKRDSLIEVVSFSTVSPSLEEFEESVLLPVEDTERLFRSIELSDVAPDTCVLVDELPTSFEVAEVADEPDLSTCSAASSVDIEEAEEAELLSITPAVLSEDVEASDVDEPLVD